MGPGSMTESVGETADALIDGDDTAYPCKGCGEILEEGKAFELAGNRWHINCFRCNTCGTLLDSDANLLLLGDGSLICNNCTYSCSACGNKIEDLAILTGDQAFCANCFRCRSCKRKIENLRYARTSQGIFCMSCHESLMARRRKKSRAAAAASKASSSAQSPMLLDKSLPSLPPNAVPATAASSERGDSLSETYTETPTELSPRPRPSNPRQDSDRSVKRERSPLTPEDARKENGHLPATTYSMKRTSAGSHVIEESGNSSRLSEAFHIPLVLDTGITTSDAMEREVGHETSTSHGRAHPADGDYFTGAAPIPPPLSRLRSKEKQLTLRPEHDELPISSAEVSPRTALEEQPPRPREGGSIPPTGKAPALPTLDTTNLPSRADHTPSSSGAEDLRLQHAKTRAPTQNGKIQSSHGERFLLQEVPKAKKSAGSSKSFQSDSYSPDDGRTSQVGTPASTGSRNNPWTSREQLGAAVKADSSQSLRVRQADESPRSSMEELVTEGPSGLLPRTNHLPSRPARRDSLRGVHTRKAISKKEIPSRLNTQSSSGSGPLDPSRSASAGVTPSDSHSALSSITNGTGGTSPSSSDSLPGTAVDVINAHAARAEERQSSSTTPSRKDAFKTMRPAPPRTTSRGDTPRNGDGQMSPGLPQYNHDSGELNLEEDMARILGETDESSTSLMRRVSNAVRHGRSFSDMEGRSRAVGKWPRSPRINGSSSSQAKDISSPTATSPEAFEENLMLKSELRRSAQRIVELEARVSGTSDMQSLDTKLREKRSTITFLDTKKELVVRELETLSQQLEETKRTQQPLNWDVLRNKATRDFAQSLEQLKRELGPAIEDLMRQKSALIEETTNLTRLRDQAIQETEQLNSKNAQLADLNNELTQQIQDRYRTHREGTLESPHPPLNALGLYGSASKERADSFPDTTTTTTSTREAKHGYAYGPSAGPVTVGSKDSADADTSVVTATPHVVEIGKGRAKKFNWKKGGQSVAKGVSKGFKGAFSSNSQHQQYHQYPPREGGVQEVGMPYNTVSGPADMVPHPMNRSNSDMPRHGLGFFGTSKPNKPAPVRMHSSGTVPTVAEGPSTLFGSDLTERADYERRAIPSVVTRCIEEVEIRGMDVEGIYRKTGGNSQVKAIQEGFEKSDDYDISDPGLDITAVTSVLKQYFRKLPLPLLTFDAYDGMLEANSLPEDEKRVNAMRATILALPPKHRDCLEFLIFHLARVATREKENLMSPRNLAVVFAPTIMRDVSIDREMTDMHIKNQAVQFLIENNKVIFGGN
ncbi:MAG: suppressor of tub2 mutation [Watsoniomyces obsoletus]|nr:MAG: suppressor of tub2 mutation [Watsoniomyces obsoletus]